MSTAYVIIALLPQVPVLSVEYVASFPYASMIISDEKATISTHAYGPQCLLASILVGFHIGTKVAAGSKKTVDTRWSRGPTKKLKQVLTIMDEFSSLQIFSRDYPESNTS